MGIWYGPAGEGGSELPPSQTATQQTVTETAKPPAQSTAVAQNTSGSMFAAPDSWVTSTLPAEPTAAQVAAHATPTAPLDAGGLSMFRTQLTPTAAATPAARGLLATAGVDAERHRRDWDGYWTSSTAGSVITLGDGSRVTRNADGSATWTDGTRSVTYDRNSDPTEVGKQTSLGASWATAYAATPSSSGQSGSSTSGRQTGTNGPYTTTPTWRSFEEYQAWEAAYGATPNFAGQNPNYRPPDWMRNMGLSGSGAEDQYKRYILFKNNPQYAADYDNIMRGGESKFATDGSTLVKSNVNEMPPAEQQYYRENPGQLALAEGSGMDPVLYRKVQTGEITIPPGVNRTQWLRENRWTANGVVPNDNVATYAAADNIGMDGQGAGTYIRPRYNSEGQIVDTDGTVHNPYQGVVQRTPGWNGGSITPESAGSGSGSGSGSGAGGTGGSGSGGSSSSSSSGSNWQVDDPQTVEGRMNNLLATDANGNYTNQVIRQAVDRANQAFAARGLLNSSMAAQAGQEAAISKATEIASADAKTYAAAASQNAQQAFTSEQNAAAFERDLAKLAAQHGYTMDELRERYGLEQTNTDNSRDDALQASYRQQVTQANANYTNSVGYINQSNMTPEQKAAAIQAAADARDAELAYVNEMFSNTPRWRSEWATVAVRVTAASVATLTNRSTLNSIINDPAQPADVRAAARARLDALNAAPPPSSGGSGGSTTTPTSGSGSNNGSGSTSGTGDGG